MTRELVPRALPAASHLAWMDPNFEGNVETFLDKVNELVQQYLSYTAVLHAVVAKPFGKKFVAKIAALDDENGGKGISLVQLKQQVRYFVEQHRLET